jgi:hypothetical protein
MSKTLLVFLFSTNVDSYINVIAHGYRHLGIKRVSLLHIEGASTGVNSEVATQLATRIWAGINGLAQGKYLDFSKDPSGLADISTIPALPLEESGVATLYAEIDKNIRERRIVSLNQPTITTDLQKIIEEHGGKGLCVLDVTAATKVPSVDIFSVCLAIEMHNLFTFELLRRPFSTDRVNNLYHALTANDYEYTPLTDRPAVRNARRLIKKRIRLLGYIVGVTLLTASVSLILLAIQRPAEDYLSVVGSIASLVGLAATGSQLWISRKP